MTRNHLYTEHPDTNYYTAIDGIEELTLPATYFDMIQNVNDLKDECQLMAKEIEASANGNLYHCPDCEQMLIANLLDNNAAYCDECEHHYHIDEMELITIDELLETAKVKYFIKGNGEYTGVRVSIELPEFTASIDTHSQKFSAQWKNHIIEIKLSQDTCDRIDDHYEDTYLLTNKSA